MQRINIGLLGLGTVGSGVFQIIDKHQQELIHKTGREVKISKILVRDIEKLRSLDIDPTLFTTKIEDLIEDESIDIIIEVAGGVDFGYEFFKKAFANHKHIITANKDLMAIHGSELLVTAKNSGCDLFFEGSVGGGIPIIRSLVDGLSSDKITQLMGIINGTTNYILTKMDQENMNYSSALAKAQTLGFAEADPTSDVGGIDAARKMAILANLAFSMPIDLEDVRIKGIESVSDMDLSYAKQLGYKLKLLGIAKIDEGAIEVSVEPTLIPLSHPLTSVNNEYNAVFVKGEAVGTTMFYGPGAGGLPTATAIVSDVISVVKNMALGTTGMHILAPQHEKSLKDKTQIISPYFLRLEVADEVGVFAEITSLFAKHNISFEKIIQDPICEYCNAEIIMVTHSISLESLENTIAELGKLPSVIGILSYYRIEN